MSIDRVGFAKPIDPYALTTALAMVIEPLYVKDLNDVPGLEPHLLAVAYRIREHLLPAFPDIMVKVTEVGLEVEVP